MVFNSWFCSRNSSPSQVLEGFHFQNHHNDRINALFNVFAHSPSRGLSYLIIFVQENSEVSVITCRFNIKQWTNYLNIKRVRFLVLQGWIPKYFTPDSTQKFLIIKKIRQKDHWWNPLSIKLQHNR